MKNRLSFCTFKSVVFGTAAVITLLSSHDSLAQATTKYDGDYFGSFTMTQNNAPGKSSACLTSDNTRHLFIKSGAVTLKYNAQYPDLTGTVSATGSVTAAANTSAGGAKLSGQIQGADFTGEVGSAYCTYALQLKKK